VKTELPVYILIIYCIMPSHSLLLPVQAWDVRCREAGGLHSS